MDLYQLILDYKKKNKPMMAVTAVSKTGFGPVEVGKKMIVLEDKKSFGTVGGGAIEYYAQKKAIELLENRENLLETYVLEEGKIVSNSKTLPMACGGEVTLFYEYIGPKETIYIFGAGHVGQALVNVLKTMNYHISVIDDRKDVIEKFERADAKYNMPFVSFIEEIGVRKNSFVIVCTPSHKYDYHVINKLIELKIEPRYLGMLCSPDKIRDYLKSTYKQFGEDLNLDYFYSPIGLDVGGNSPEEIAISISAEILSISHNKKGHNHMRSVLDGQDRYW